ncbi:phosphoglycerate mutase [Cryptococcus wingfieldii CBS 7118]|uniref:Phosphoglycerate mutase n=1 Tax=Cryptococcus wingfieldii CBS 7118 TaxID=1295528 RepID=A0A1E3I5F7_9TREE|nr:phosphoglycerate mutase [Cryptococcus wingfieldii CBS 7118]ODN83924.1 phosphoglycerate mutase [Cryptococcus wingfieldii CBS 7118]
MTQHDSPPVASLESGGPAIAPEVEEPPHEFVYEVVQGFFVQNGPEPKHIEFEDLLGKSFGLIDESPDRWHNLKASIEVLQNEAPAGVIYKVLFLGRHGQGFHNVAESKYGTEAWEAKWALLNGNGELTWGPDPFLTPLGVSQAQAVNDTWRKEAPLGAPVKSGEMRWYCSPMTRTGETMETSWKDVLEEGERIEVWEDFREIYGVHTCDKRSTKSIIKERFPAFTIEDGLTEEDELWKPDDRETDEHMQFRARRAMDRLFGRRGAGKTYISITGHSAIFRNLLAVLNHQPYPLATGEMIPVVVKATHTSIERPKG